MGNTYAEVNLTTQHMYYVKDGHIALETDVVTGNPNKGNATPTGVYSLAYKAKDQTLKGTKKADGTYEYETPVNTGCRLTEVSVSMMHHGSLHLEAAGIRQMDHMVV